MKKIVLLLLSIFVLLSCRSQQLPTKIDQETKGENVTHKETQIESDSQKRIDETVSETVNVILQRISEMEWQYNKTDYSPPDSTGKQHTTRTEQGKMTNKTKENSDRKVQTDIQYQEVNRLLVQYIERIDRVETYLQNIEAEEKERFTWFQSILMISGCLLLISIGIRIYSRLKEK